MSEDVGRFEYDQLWRGEREGEKPRGDEKAMDGPILKQASKVTDEREKEREKKARN